MYGRCKPALIFPTELRLETDLKKNIACVYQELSINFQYANEAGLQYAGMTPEGC